jgi:hypothetical protein
MSLSLAPARNMVAGSHGPRLAPTQDTKDNPKAARAGFADRRMSGNYRVGAANEKPRSGGAPGFPNRTIQGFGGDGTVLLSRTAPQGQQFQVYDRTRVSAFEDRPDRKQGFKV